MRPPDLGFPFLGHRAKYSSTAVAPADWHGMVLSTRQLTCAGPPERDGSAGAAVAPWPLVLAHAHGRVMSKRMTILSQPEVSEPVLQPYDPWGRTLMRVE